MSKNQTITNKVLALKRYVLSLMLVFFLLLATALMLETGIPENASLVDFAILLSPLFILPFYHFLYELLGVKPLSVSDMLINFRLRGSLALLLSANIIFISLNDLNSLISLAGHFILGYLAVLGMFYLCTTARKRPSDFEPLLESSDDALAPVILRYGISALEIFYYLSLLFLVFLSGFGEPLGLTKLWFFALSLGFLLLITTFISKIHSSDKASLLSFFENKAVPLSFIFFGIMHLVDANF